MGQAHVNVSVLCDSSGGVWYSCCAPGVKGAEMSCRSGCGEPSVEEITHLWNLRLRC